MKKILVLGSSKDCKELVLEAKHRGYYTVVTDYLEPYPSGAKLAADEYWMISTVDFDLLEQKCREEHIEAVICGISAINNAATIELCNRLKLPCYCTPNTYHYSANKRDFKDICKSCGVLTSPDYFVSNPPTDDELEQISFPVVVKAVDQRGNIGMSYCNTKDEIAVACDLARSVSNSNTVIVEDVLGGYEYGAHYALAEGKASLVGFVIMLNQPGYPSNCYSITTTCTNNLKRYMEEFHPYFMDALNKMGCHEGYLWVELMEGADGHLNALEIGYRMSGEMLCDQLKISGIFNAYAWILDIATGNKHRKEDLPVSLTALPEKIITSYILWSKEGGTISKIEGLEKLVDIPSINIVDNLITIGSTVRKHQYMIIFTFESENCDELCETIQVINDSVNIYDENGENIVIYYDDFVTLHKLDEESKL